MWFCLSVFNSSAFIRVSLFSESFIYFFNALLWGLPVVTCGVGNGFSGLFGSVVVVLCFMMKNVIKDKTVWLLYLPFLS